MREKVLIVIIGILVACVIGIGIYIVITPTIIPEKPVIQFPDNELAEKLGIVKLNREVPRIFAVKNYSEDTLAKDVNALGVVRYHILNNKATDHMMIVPFESGGDIIVGKVVYDEYKEAYVCGMEPENIIINEKVVPGYGLLLKYSRPSTEIPEIYIRVIEGDKVATYYINALKNNEKLVEIEQVKQDVVISQSTTNQIDEE